METTREGRRFILAACLIGLAAFNTGNNLIYLILSLMLSLALLSLLVMRINVSGISAAVHLGHPVFAGERASLSVLLENRRRLPAYSLHLTPAVSGIEAGAAYCAAVPAGGRSDVSLPSTFLRRGLYRDPVLDLQSGFPFILFRRRVRINARGELLVYPALIETDGMPFLRAGHGLSSIPRRVGGGEELHSLREYRAGDDLRKIHWKTSAKRDELMVREYAEHESRKVTVALDNLWREGGTAGADEAEFEKAVSLAASVARHFLDAGFAVSLTTCRKGIPFGLGSGHLMRMLDLLAVVGLEDAWDESPPGEGDISISVLRRRNGSVPQAGIGAIRLYAEDI